MKKCFLAVIATTMIASSALAGETITYKYDERGRLVKVTHTGGPTDGGAATYAYDAANNRASVKLQPRIVIVVPLNGYTVIPINAN